jgi:hypothetical protein
MIIYVYSIWQDIFEAMRRNLRNVIFLQNIPTEEELVSLTDQSKHSVIVIDDMLNELGKSTFVSDLVTKLGHHMKVTSILITQNNGFGGKYKSNITKNTHYNILMHSPRDALAVRTLGTQLSDYRNLISAYKSATEETFGYLLCDCHPRSNPQFRYRTHIFPDQYCIIYSGK